jgi:hypothetical protein
VWVIANGESNVKIARLVMFYFALALTTIGAFAAEPPDDPPPAPIPAPIFTAKKVFISNASGEVAVPAGTPDVTYNEFCAAVKSWGRYELVSAPSDADLVFEIQFALVIGPTDVTKGSGDSRQSFQIRLTILDPKTHVVLWPIVRTVRPWNLAATGRKNFDQAMANLVDDLKKLVTPSSITPPSPKN